MVRVCISFLSINNHRCDCNSVEENSLSLIEKLQSLKNVNTLMLKLIAKK